MNKLSTKQELISPKVKDVLILLSAGTFLAASLIMPGLPLVLKPYLDKKRQDEQKEWEKFNLNKKSFSTCLRRAIT